MNTNAYPVFTKVRTNLLGKVNYTLDRQSTVRSAVSCIKIKQVQSALLEAGVDSYKLDCLKNIPDDQAICVCRLANCCDDRKDCYFCAQISNFEHVDKEKWYAQNDVQMLTYFEGNMKSHAVVNKFYVEQDDGSLQMTHQFVPAHINPCDRYKNKIICTNGDSCKFYRYGTCAFLHKEDLAKLEEAKLANAMKLSKKTKSDSNADKQTVSSVDSVEPKKKLTRRKKIVKSGDSTDAIDTVEPKKKLLRKKKSVQVESIKVE